jgi:hypothetical protein
MRVTQRQIAFFVRKIAYRIIEPVSCFLKVLKILKGLAIFAIGKFAPSLRGYFQKSLKRGAGVEPLPT